MPFLMLLLMLFTGCAGRSSPAPVTTLELRKQQIQQQQQRAPLTQSSYVVQRGDTLYSIAFRAGQDFRSLAARNNIQAPYTIYPGQTIQLSASTNRALASTPATTSSSRNSETTPTNRPQPIAANNQKSYGQVSSAQQTRATPQPAAANTNRVSWQWPVRGQILARFSSAEHGSKGIAIGGNDGARINAAAAGQVVYAGNALRGYGNLIIIKHNDDYLSAYAHNKRILVKERQEVTAGQQIAEMGDTDTSSTRLHFEIRFRGQSVDPLRYLPR